LLFEVIHADLRYAVELITGIEVSTEPDGDDEHDDETTRDDSPPSPHPAPRGSWAAPVRLGRGDGAVLDTLAVSAGHSGLCRRRRVGTEIRFVIWIRLPARGAQLVSGNKLSRIGQLIIKRCFGHAIAEYNLAD
jgi:hypothetical protein